ncbi:DUF411 domain-containing protein [Cognatilysobacter bugurensis]|uniref:DUF411 domain-containing protein n=1 Tax=Cognatilysobacter bugurensis TaxID=543356 RepID=A0A918W996_9GAMM|nr:DUF411 domain-containing protein [Lysobacter bugurensis]GHA80447.1 hypothetical protein GCM10007067_17790 [Lysobacter bugurensis]
MKTQDRHPLRSFAGSRTLCRSAAWLLGASIALGACAEPAPPASGARDADPAAAAAGRQAPSPYAAPAPVAAPAAPATADAHAGHSAAPAAAASANGPTSTKVGAAVVDASLPRMKVHKSPTCGCCSLWVDHVREAGFAVEVHDTHDLAAVKSRLGVPADAQSCHTAEVGGLVVEGHVPAEDIKRALAQRDTTRALLLPGMPLNSPGMEVPGVNALPYTVERIKADGTREPFATHGE